MVIANGYIVPSVCSEKPFIWGILQKLKSLGSIVKPELTDGDLSLGIH